MPAMTAPFVLRSKTASSGFGQGHCKGTRPDLLHKAADAYGHVLPLLLKNCADDPSREQTTSLIKDGSSGNPQFRYVWPDGLSDPKHLGRGNWGGRFERGGGGREFVSASDLRDRAPDLLYPVRRWWAADQNA
jgi:hypothetical protein